MMSGSNDYSYEENFERMRKRFTEIGLILKDHGCTFGIEFLGPKTIRTDLKYDFVHDLPGMIELCDAVGTGFPRLRIGVGGAEERIDLAQYVLAPFSPNERPRADAAVQRAADAVEVAIRDGLERAMNIYNRPPTADE